MKRILLFMALLIISSAAFSQKKDINLNTGPALDSIIDSCLVSINSDSIHNNIQQLEDFGTRFCLANNHRDVAVWLQNRYIALGYTNTVLDSFQITFSWNSQLYNTYGYNIIATLDGTETPDNIYIVGGHYDDIVFSSGGDPLVTAPGADDNGSSTAAILEIARVFKEKNYQPKSTIKFIAFAAEELGLYGSIDYASKAVVSGEKIQLMINCDMIGTNTEAPGTWHVNLQNYSGCENATALAKYIMQNYTTLYPIDVNGNSGGSDSHSFWINGFPTIFLEEYQFSPVYHSVNDLTVNIDPVYCAEVTKVACGMLLQSIESPAKVKGLVINDVGNGISLSATWQSSQESKLAGYKVYVGLAPHTYDTSYATTDTNYIITELTEGIQYYTGVTAIDSADNEGLAATAGGIPLSTPRVPAGLEQLVSSSFIKTGWGENHELDLMGYNVYRSDTPGGSYTKVNSGTVTDTSYTDSTVADHTYYYEVSAIDSSLNESLPSTAVKTRTITHDLGILIVDDSEGGWLNPTDQQVDDFYNNLIDAFTHDNYDAFDSAKISLADMGAYSSLFWHINRKVNQPVFYKNQKEVKKYLESGGNLLFTVYQPQGAAQNISDYPYNYYPGDFIYDYMKIGSSELTDEGLFRGATPFATAYDSLYLDTLKVNPSNNYHVLGIEAINPNSESSTILKYDTYFSPSTPSGNMKDKNVGVEYLGPDFKAITISFPLYFINYNEAKAFTGFVMQQKFGEIMGIKEQESTDVLSFSIYPNPVSDVMTLNIFSDKNTDASFEILSVTGQLMKKYSFECAQGLQQKQINVSSLPEGFYICSFKTGNCARSAKMMIER